MHQFNIGDKILYKNIKGTVMTDNKQGPEDSYCLIHLHNGKMLYVNKKDLTKI